MPNLYVLASAVALGIVLVGGVIVLLVYCLKKKPATSVQKDKQCDGFEIINALSQKKPTKITKTLIADVETWCLAYDEGEKSLYYSRKGMTAQLLLEEPFLRLEMRDDGVAQYVVMFYNRGKVRYAEDVDIEKNRAALIHQIFDRILPLVTAVSE